MGTEISYWLRLNGTFDKREMLLEAICRIFLTEQLHMDEKLFRSFFFATMPRLMQERYVCGNRQVREENGQLLLTLLETLTPQHETWKIQEKE